MFIMGGITSSLDVLELTVEKDTPLDEYRTNVGEGIDDVIREFNAIENELDTGDLEFYTAELEICIDDDMDREQIRATVLDCISNIRSEIRNISEG